MRYKFSLTLFLATILVVISFQKASAVYDATEGRWLSRDPLNNAEILQGTNLYNYVGNEPINLIDRLGLAGLNLIGTGDEMKAWGDQVPTTVNGYYTVVAHGAPGMAQFDSPQYGAVGISGNALARFIGGQPNYKPGTPVLLLICEGGKASKRPDDSLGRLVSDMLNVEVKATPLFNIINEGGAFYPNWPGKVTSPDVNNTNEYPSFVPRQKH